MYRCFPSAIEPILNQDLYNFTQSLWSGLTGLFTEYVDTAKALMMIFMLLYFALKCYGMMSGDSRWDIMPLLRPFALALVVINWNVFIGVIKEPADAIETQSMSQLSTLMTEVDNANNTRETLIDSLNQKIIKADFQASEAVHNQQKVEDDAAWYDISGDIEQFTELIGEKIAGYFLYMKSKMTLWLGEVLEKIATVFFQGAFLLIMIIRIIFAAILVILGPFAFAFSVLPGFRNAYLSWIARFVSVSLYGTVASIGLSVTFSLLKACIVMETDRYQQLLAVTDEWELVRTLAASPGLFGYYLIGIFISTVFLFMVPFISTWIIHATEMGGALSSAIRQTRNLASF